MANRRLHGIKCSNFFSSLNLDFMIKVKTGESKLQSKTKNLLCILFLSFDRPDVFCNEAATAIKSIWQSICSVDPERCVSFPDFILDCIMIHDQYLCIRVVSWLPLVQLSFLAPQHIITQFLNRPTPAE